MKCQRFLPINELDSSWISQTDSSFYRLLASTELRLGRCSYETTCVSRGVVKDLLSPRCICCSPFTRSVVSSVSNWSAQAHLHSVAQPQMLLTIVHLFVVCKFFFLQVSVSFWLENRFLSFFVLSPYFAQFPFFSFSFHCFSSTTHLLKLGLLYAPWFFCFFLCIHYLFLC